MLEVAEILDFCYVWISLLLTSNCHDMEQV